VRYLLLHGFTGAPASFDALGPSADWVVPTLGGHLGSEARGSFDDEVERLASLGEGCSGLVGYSLGGRFALGILARYPQRFEHALIISAQAGLATTAERAARRTADERFVRLLREQGLTAFVDAWQALPLWASQGSLSPALKAEQRALRLQHTAEGLAESLVHHGLGEMPDLRPNLRRVRASVDVLVGERDPKFQALGRELCELIGGARLTNAPGAGHNLLLERPELCRSLLQQ
jgi:2-succinyl-6-hydroxy-2,4-cyclohexadiene-1-carboxylate synthase